MLRPTALSTASLRCIACLVVSFALSPAAAGERASLDSGAGPGSTARRAGAAARIDDASALVQTAVDRRRQEERALRSWAGRRLGGSSSRPPAHLYDCDAEPALCTAPMHCDKPGDTRPSKPDKPIAEGRHANPRSFCGLPYETAVARCVSGNLSAYAEIMYRTQARAGLVGKATVDFDAQYCFIVGHCDNAAVNDTTTVAEGERMCDRRYGRWHSGKPWYEFSMMDLVASAALSPLSGGMNLALTARTPLHVNLNRNFAHSFAKLACAMGNYHCDARYCQLEYCKDPYYRSKYAVKRVASTLDAPW